MNDASTVGNFLLKIANSNTKTVTSMQLQKLVFLAHGWMLGKNNTPLIANRIEAWPYGPVIPDLYEQTRHYKDGPITATLKSPLDFLNDASKTIIEKTYNTYCDLNAFQLSALTHLPNTPWSVIHNSQGNWFEIPNSLIRSYYMNKNKQQMKYFVTI